MVPAMNLALRRSMTMADFLAWESRQDLRYEFDGVQAVAMTGGTAAHSAIQRNLAISIGGRLRGTPCQFHGSDLKVQVAGSIRYPDGLVVCMPLPPGATLVHDPVVIFEVLSDSTAVTDRIVKNREYEATPSVRRYVMLEQDRVAATVFVRDGADWVGHLLTGEAAVLALPEIGLSPPLAELYEGVELAGDAAAGQGGDPDGER